MKTISRNVFIFISFIWFCCPAATAKENPPETSSEGDNREQIIEEVTVVGIRDVHALRLQVIKAEDRVIELFNELNDDDLYDIHCRMEARYGSRIRTRECRPAYVNMATAEEAKGWLYQFTGPFNQGAGMIIPANFVIAIHTPKLFEKINKFIRENSDFSKAVMEHQELREELKEKRKLYLDNTFGWTGD